MMAPTLLRGSRRAGSPERLCKMAVDLADYLKIKFDPYDFTQEWILERWNEEYPEFAVDPERYKPPQEAEAAEQFERWVTDKIVPEILRGDPRDLPAYMHFTDVSVMPKGSWLVHFSKSAYFARFDRGVTLEDLAYSTWRREKDMAPCDVNRYPHAGLGDLVWGFAFSANDRSVGSYGARKYGRHVVLFQTDCAVSAWHHGDHEQQMIFPICSEYNRHSGSYDGDFNFTDRLGESVVSFSDIDDAIDAAERGELERE